MIKEALQYLISLGNVEEMEIGGQKFATKPVCLVKEPTVPTLTVSTLAGLIDYINSDFDTTRKLLVHVESPTTVTLHAECTRDQVRDTYMQAEAVLPQFSFSRYYDAENFNIALQSIFCKTDTRDQLLKLVGNVKEEAAQTVVDDGVSQTVTAKTGVATVETVLLPNPISLKPFRTFVEVPQPESLFVFRMQKGPQFALFEADGGAWRIEAVDTIAKYLQDKLTTRIHAGQIVLIS